MSLKRFLIIFVVDHFTIRAKHAAHHLHILTIDLGSVELLEAPMFVHDALWFVNHSVLNLFLATEQPRT